MPSVKDVKDMGALEMLVNKPAAKSGLNVAEGTPSLRSLSPHLFFSLIICFIFVFQYKMLNHYASNIHRIIRSS